MIESSSATDVLLIFRLLLQLKIIHSLWQEMNIGCNCSIVLQFFSDSESSCPIAIL
jgi:hypothetical protein